MRTMRLLALLAIAVFALIGCRGGQRPAGPALQLTIAEASQPVFALLYVADAKGFLKEAGLDVTFKRFTLGRDALASVIAGGADLATVYETPVVIRVTEGQPLAIVSTLHTSARNTALVARRDRGIAKPLDLIGKRIGFTRGTSTEYFLQVFLATEKIPRDSVIPVNIEPADYDRALLEGEVDALILFEPHQSRLRMALGERAAVFHSDVYVEASMLVGLRATVDAKREAISRLLVAIVRAQEFVAANREESIVIVAKALAGRVEEPTIRASWDATKHEARLDNALVTALALEAQWLRDSGRLKGPQPDFRRSVVAGPLKAAKPDAVTLRDLDDR